MHNPRRSAPSICVYPALLDLPAPEVLAYPREAVVAEKLEAIVVLRDSNSRIKDFFDLHYLASQYEFDRPTLDAVRKGYGRVRFGHSELTGFQLWDAACDEGERAVRQVMEMV